MLFYYYEVRVDMSSVIIAVSGCGGGNSGPKGMYHRLGKHLDGRSVEVLNIETIPDNIAQNIESVNRLAHEAIARNQNVYLMGYSMGAAVAAIAAQQLNSDGKNSVKGVGLISSQTDGLSALFELNIPVLFYHGSADPFFSSLELLDIFRKYQGPKQFVIIENAGHNLCPEGSKYVSDGYVEELSKEVAEGISHFLLESSAQSSSCENVVTKKIPVKSWDSFVNALLSWKF